MTPEEQREIGNGLVLSLVVIGIVLIVLSLMKWRAQATEVLPASNFVEVEE